MARRRGFSQTVQLRSPRRQTAWALGPGGTAAEATSVGGSQLIGSGVAPNIEGLTMIRIRGELMSYLLLATTALDGFECAFGIGIVEEPAFAAGIASVPTPLTDEDSENWLYHRYFALKAGFAFSSGADPAGNRGAFLRLEVDSKAMRKFDPDKRIYAALEVVEVGTATMQTSFNSRSLVKLS